MYASRASFSSFIALSSVDVHPSIIRPKCFMFCLELTAKRKMCEAFRCSFRESF